MRLFFVIFIIKFNSMYLLNNFIDQIKNVFEDGVFGVSLYDFGIIFIALIFALLVRGIFAKLVVLMTNYLML